MKAYRFYFISLLFMFGLISWGAFADGGGGWREPTPKEKEFHHTVLTTIQNALPAGPDGWRQVSDPNLEELTRVYKGSEKEPFDIDYHIGWQDAERKSAGDQKVSDALLTFEQSHANDPQVAALKEQGQQILEGPFKQALAKNDTAAMEQCMKEMDALNAKLKAIYDAWDKDRDAIIAANEAHDVDLEIWVRVNNFHAYEKMEVGTPVAGNPVYRIPGGHIGGAWVGEQNMVLLGKNLKMSYSEYVMEVKFPPAPGLPNTSVRLIEVFVQADPDRARQVLKNINWGMLKGLIK